MSKRLKLNVQMYRHRQFGYKIQRTYPDPCLGAVVRAILNDIFNLFFLIQKIELLILIKTNSLKPVYTVSGGTFMISIYFNKIKWQE